jgi:hypothetical protein
MAPAIRFRTFSLLACALLVAGVALPSASAASIAAPGDAPTLTYCAPGPTHDACVIALSTLCFVIETTHVGQCVY